MEREKPKVKNPLGMLVMTGIVILLVGYLYWDTLKAYLAGGEGAPSLAVVVIGGLLLLGGCIYMVQAAIRIYLQDRKEKKEQENGSDA